MTQRENGRGGVTADVKLLLESVPNSKVIKIKGGAAQEAGLPDFFFTCAALGGRAVWIEVKAPGEKPRRLQKHKLEELRRAGALTVWVTSAAQLEAILGHLHVIPAPEVEPIGPIDYEVKRGPWDGPYGPNEVKYANAT